MKKQWLVLVLLASTTINILGYVRKTSKPVQHQHQPYVQQIRPPIEQPPQEVKPNITTEVPTGELSFEEIYATLDKWHAQAPDITEVGEVGKTHEGRPIKYIRIGKKTGPKVLITATIHGNEKLCTMTALGVFNNILKAYMVDEKATELLRTRDIYFIPVVSPEGYINNSRHVLGRDPNRDFNGPNLSEKKSMPHIQALKDFHLKHRFKAVMSCHDYGRVYFHPWGYVRKKTPVDSEYKRILGKMGEASGYNFEQLHHQSVPPYYGYEADWFCQAGAFSIVNEIGTRFEARRDEIEKEVQDNYKPFLIFIDEAPLVGGSIPFLYSIDKRVVVPVSRPRVQFLFKRLGVASHFVEQKLLAT